MAKLDLILTALSVLVALAVALWLTLPAVQTAQVGLGVSAEAAATAFSSGSATGPPTAAAHAEEASMPAAGGRRASIEHVLSFPAQPPLRGLQVTSYFGWRSDPISGAARHHAGVDLRAEEGTPVFAPGLGRVDTLGYSSSYGLYLTLSHPASGYASRLAHLSGFVPSLRAGLRVMRGQRLAYSGSTGRSTAPHVHFEITRLSDGSFVDPALVYAEYERARSALAATLGPVRPPPRPAPPLHPSPFSLPATHLLGEHLLRGQPMGAQPMGEPSFHTEDSHAKRVEIERSAEH